ncbi:hypothetical protein [Butyrivibrio sp. NC3005]
MFNAISMDRKKKFRDFYCYVQVPLRARIP